MQCTHCGHTNSARARFCENCGRALPRACSNCGESVSPAARYCPNCGQNLQAAPPAAEPLRFIQAPAAAANALERLRDAAPPELQQSIRLARSQLEGERKLVSALFVDIVGSTGLAEQLDPEDWRQIVTGVHERVGAAVHRYGGYIAQLLGDGVLAFFGAPLAHEDDAERAVRAGLDSLSAVAKYAAEPATRRLAPRLQVRAGINTGTVVVGEIGSDLRMEYLAVGDTVNLAARLQTAAPPYRLLISDNTRRLLGDQFDLEDQGRLDLKGKAEPVQVYCVIAARSGASSARGIAGLTSPLVGRQRELAVLRRLADDLAAGLGGIVTVVAEAGIGKSRLAAEWRTEVAHDLPLRWATARCLSYDASVPYQLVMKIVRNLLKLAPHVADSELTAALREQCRQLCGEGAAGTIPYLAHLLGGGLGEEETAQVRYLDGHALQVHYVAALRTLLTGSASHMPLVILIDDVQWADVSSVELLAQLLPLAGQLPLIFTLLSRPDRDAPGWRLITLSRELAGVGVVELHLAPLGEGDSRRLVDNLLTGPSVPPALTQLVLSKSEGNPFYMEEVLRMLIDRGALARANSHWDLTREVRELEIPDSLQGVIAARIDRLPEDTKRLLQVAAVIGRRFPTDVLQKVASGLEAFEQPQTIAHHLAVCEAADLVRATSDGTGRGYAFKHSLIQETVYAGLLRTARADLHRRVGEAIEELKAGDEGQRAAHLALHYERAGLSRQAFDFAMLAGDLARQHHAHHEALAFYDRAIALAGANEAGELRERLGRAYWARGQAHQGMSDQRGALADYEAMLAEARARGSTGEQAEALTWLLPMRILSEGITDTTEAQLQEALELARQSGDRFLQARSLWNIGLAWRFNDPLRGIRSLEEAARMAEAGEATDLRMRELRGYVLIELGIALYVPGHFGRAGAHLRMAIDIFRGLNHLPMLADALIGSSLLEYELGNLQSAERAAEEGCELAHRAQNPWAIAYACMSLAPLALDRGQFGRAQALIDELKTNANQVQFPVFISQGHLNAARLHLELGENETSAKESVAAAEALHPMQAALWVAVGLTLRAQAALLRGRPEEAWEFVADLTRPGPERDLDFEGIIMGFGVLAEVALSAGRHTEGIALCEWLGARVAAEKAMRPQAEAAFWQGRLELAAGRPQAAIANLTRAEELLDRCEIACLSWQAAAELARGQQSLGQSEAGAAALARSRAKLRALL